MSRRTPEETLKNTFARFLISGRHGISETTLGDLRARGHAIEQVSIEGAKKNARYIRLFARRR